MNSTDGSQPTQKKATKRSHQIAAAVIGNALEWYDFLIFGYLTVVVSKLFFPSSSEYGSLLATTATFGVGFFMRPVGGVLLGIFADRFGRKASLQLIISITTFSMLLMTCAPTYQTAGIFGALIILLARLLQGFAAGGEFASATSFLVECAPAQKRGLFGSWQMVGQGLAKVFGTSIGALLTYSLSDADLYSWGWRIPFALGLLIGPVGMWIRRNMEEPEAYIEAKRSHTSNVPLLEIVRKYHRPLWISTALTTCGTISTYTLFIYFPTYAHTYLKISLNEAFLAELAAGIAITVLAPLYGALSDRTGRKPILFACLTVHLLALYPMFSWLASSPNMTNLTIMLVTFSCIIAGYTGVVSSVLAEQFPTHVRSTAMAIAYNIAVMTFGGSAQFLATWLIKETGNVVAPAFYLIFGAVVGLIATAFIREPSRADNVAFDLDIEEPVAVAITQST